MSDHVLICDKCGLTVPKGTQFDWEHRCAPRASDAWTTTPPTEPGRYWARFARDRTIHFVVVTRDGSALEAQPAPAMDDRDEGHWELSFFDLWSGPLAPPPLPKEKP